MAKTTTHTRVYELHSRTSDTVLFATERSLTKFQKINGRIVRTVFRAELRDPEGRHFDSIDANLVRCRETGEIFSIFAQVPSIRKVSS